ncbi:MAG: M28 family peptidase, partial [Gemmatimonadota bacterium]
MPLLRPIRLHRRPAVDALLLVAAVALAFFLLQSAVAHPRRLVMVSDSARFDADAALYNTRLLSDTFRFRTTGSAQGHAAAGWLASRFEQLGLDVRQQEFELSVRGQRVTGRNVVAHSGGRMPGAVVLMAHFDGPTTSGQSAGASASGVGTMLELARVLESKPHRRPFIYVAADAGTWGHVGAAAYARSIAHPDSIVAAISIDHVANGPATGVALAGAAQGPGYAPLWLRVAAADAYAVDGTAVQDAGPVREWYLRTIRLSEEDQGPLVARGIPAVNLGTVPARPSYAQFLHHTPGDRVETLEPPAFRVLGAGIERLVLALDRNEQTTGPFEYLRVGGDRMVRGVAILLAAIALFLPLLLTTWEALHTTRVDPAARAAIRSETVRALGWWLIAGAGYLALQGLVVTGMLPRFEIYPATERDPFIFAVRWVPMLVVLVVTTLAAYGLALVRRRLRLVSYHPYAGRAVALATLVILAAIALVRNPFATVWLLALPAWLWPWIGPTRRSLTGATGTILVVLSAAPAFVIALVIGQRYQLGIRTGWYL